MSPKIDPSGVCLILLLLLMGLSPTLSVQVQQEYVEPCNGLSENCEKQYTDVTYPETHNAHSSIDEGYNFLAANHRLNLSQQWDAGYRAFMLDIHHSRYSESLENTSFCHGTCILGSQNAVELLSIIHDKMNSSTRDVVTLLFEVHVPYSHIAYILNKSGLIDKVHTQTLNEEWPTLSSMIDSQRNLVVFIEGSSDSNYLHQMKP